LNAHHKPIISLLVFTGRLQQKSSENGGGKADMLRKPPGVHKVSPGEGREAMVKRWFPAFFELTLLHISL